MKNTILLGAVAALLCFSSAASAQDVFVRNRPFKQVVKVGSETFVPADAFLRALGYNWTVKGQTVTLTAGPAANSEFPTGNLTFVNGDKTVVLEATRRGNYAFVSMAPLARFLDYAVVRSSGIIDVNKGRAQTAADKKVAAEVNQEKVAREKAIDEAWAKKAAEIKEKREAAAEKDKGTEEGDKSADKDKSVTKDKSSKDHPVKTPADTKSVADKGTSTTEALKPTTPADEKKNEPKPAPRLEVFRADATPDYSTGIVSIEAEIRNQGTGPASSVSGTLVLYGSNDEGNKEVEYYRTSVHGPALKADGSWIYKTEYRDRRGASMPHGTMRAELKLN